MANYKFVEDNDAIMKRIERDLKELASYEIAVGVQGAEAAENYDDSGATVAEVAVWNEFGTSKIPQRPFMQQTAERHDNWGDETAKTWNAVIDGENPKIGANLIGEKVKGDIQEEIANGEFTPNAPRTIAKKKSARPLIDTGRMRQSITYKVRTGK
nr:MAG TPA: virion morphogenesis protein [Caudoviricetes sp.]